MKNTRGFTLIEMLVVLLMIALLFGMITGSLYTARKRARITRAEAQLRELLNAWGQYYLYNNDRAGFNLGDLPGQAFEPMSEAKLTPLTTPDGYNITIMAGIQFRDGFYLDPWRRPYQVKFDTTSGSGLGAVQKPAVFRTTVSFLNKNNY